MTDLNAPTTRDRGALAWRAFQQHPEFLALLSLDGTVIEVNEAVLRRGLHPEGFIGLHIAETPYFSFDRNWRQIWDARLQEVGRSGAAVGYDDVIPGAEGGVRYAEATVAPIFDDAGTLECFLVTADDTTERLQVELALREGERRVQDLMVTLPVVAFSLDASGECDFVNQRWLDELGTLPTVDGEPNWTAVIHPDDRHAFDAAWTAARAAAAPLSGRYRVVGSSGESGWCDVRISPVLGDDGTVARWSGVAVDEPPRTDPTRED